MFKGSWSQGCNGALAFGNAIVGQTPHVGQLVVRAAVMFQLLLLSICKGQEVQQPLAGRREEGGCIGDGSGGNPRLQGPTLGTEKIHIEISGGFADEVS